MVGCPFLHVTIQGNFALRRDLLLSTVTKVGKNTGRNLRFLHLPAPLPLMPTPNNASVSTVAPYERQRRKKKVDSSYATITTVFCKHVV